MRMFFGKLARVLTGAPAPTLETNPETPGHTWDGTDAAWLGAIAPEGTILTAPIYPDALEQRVFHKYGPRDGDWESTGSNNMGDLHIIAHADTIIGAFGNLPDLTVVRWGY